MTFMIGRIQGGGSGGQMMNFGKSRAKKNEDIGKTVTFQDVAGLDEEKRIWKRSSASLRIRGAA